MFISAVDFLSAVSFSGELRGDLAPGTGGFGPLRASGVEFGPETVRKTASATLIVRALVCSTNGTSLSVSHCVQDACDQNVPGLIARRRQSVAFFGPFSGHGTAGPQGCEVASDAELIVKTEFTLKLVPFVC